MAAGAVARLRPGRARPLASQARAVTPRPPPALAVLERQQRQRGGGGVRRVAGRDAPGRHLGRPEHRGARTRAQVKFLSPFALFKYRRLRDFFRWRQNSATVPVLCTFQKKGRKISWSSAPSFFVARPVLSGENPSAWRRHWIPVQVVQLGLRGIPARVRVLCASASRQKCCTWCTSLASDARSMTLQRRATRPLHRRS